MNGRPTYWDSSGKFFLFWCAVEAVWSMSNVDQWPEALAGKCNGFAAKRDNSSFTDPRGWQQWDDGWKVVRPEVACEAAEPSGGAAAATGQGQAELRSSVLWDAQLVMGDLGQQGLLVALEAASRMAEFLRPAREAPPLRRGAPPPDLGAVLAQAAAGAPTGAARRGRAEL